MVVPPEEGGPGRRVTERLVAAGCVAAAEEAEALAAAAPDRHTLDAWVSRREQGEPLAWIVGSTPFCGRAVAVARGVFVPRHQSEGLARRAASRLPRAGRAVDLCTGSGAIAAHLMAAVPGAAVVGVDIDPVAARCARSNGVPVLVADIAGDEPLRAQSIDVVTAVTPYVPTADLRLLPADVQRYEPRLALDGGDDGLSLCRRALATAARLLRTGGWVLLEVGGRQDEILRPDLDAAGFGPSRCWHDEDGDLRGLAARRLS